MPLTKAIFSNMFLEAAHRLAQESDHLCEIDSRFGDGDHGVTMNKIAHILETAVSQWESQSIQNFLNDLGNAVLSISGGSAGPLWGTMLGGLALPVADEAVEVDAAAFKVMLASALSEIETITAARVGDKTMMDVLIPAVQAAQTAGDDVLAVLSAAATAAAQGAKDTEKYIARFGRAKNYKEQTIGTPDAGAISLMVFFQGLEAGAQKDCGHVSKRS